MASTADHFQIIPSLIFVHFEVLKIPPNRRSRRPEVAVLIGRFAYGMSLHFPAVVSKNKRRDGLRLEYLDPLSKSRIT